jgi:tetratricopeptide (TPR) repeat protein
MKNTVILTLLTTVLISLSVHGQNGWNWPEDKATAQVKYAMYTDALKNDNYPEALNNLTWLLENAPDLNASSYINGLKIYEELADNESDAAKKLQYQEKALEMYDLRIKYFNKEDEVMNRKASTAYKFFRADQDKYPELLDTFEKALELNGDQFFDGNTIAYMDIIRRYKKSGGDISDEEILERYDKITEVLSSKQGDNIVSMQSKIDEMLLEIIDVDCDYVENELGNKLKQEPGNIKLAKRIIQLSLSGKCADGEIFMSAAKIMFEAEPDYGLAKVIALKCKANDDNACTEEYLKKALELTDDNVEKGEVYLIMGAMQVDAGSQSNARNYFKQAAAADPSLAEKAYTSIGNLYFNSADQCKQGVSKVDDRGCYLAAYEMYQKAGNTSAMGRAKQQFPSKEEVFLEGKSVGAEMEVGCWISETVTIQTRD